MTQKLTAFPSAMALSRAIADLRLDPVTLAKDCLQKAEDAYGVYISTLPERALVEAETARLRARAGCRLGPLDGVPISWKDLYDVKGAVTTAGSKVCQILPAWADAPVVQRVAAAGMVSIGKTNMTELAYSGLGLNPHYGTPRNPHDTVYRRVPGGSSSGAAVAVAIGSAAIGVATDTAGSIRIPAAFNGLVGFKTSSRRHDRTGVFKLSQTLDSLGSIARTVEDCVVFDACMSGRLPVLPKPASVETYRIVVDEGVLADASLTPAVRENLERAIALLQDRGVRIERRRLKSVDAVLELIRTRGWLGAAEAYTQHSGLLKSDRAALLDTRVRARLQTAASMPVDAAVSLYWAREQLQRELTAELEGAVLVLPTVAHTAPLLEPLEADPELFAQVNLATLRLTMIGSYLDLPTFALPTGTDAEGQYTSMQISLPTGEDDQLIRVALAVEHMLTTNNKEENQNG